MSCRNVIAVFLAASLLAGCQTWQEVQTELGMYPVDPPRAETPLPPPGTVTQANWAAQRAQINQYTHQTNTTPVGYQDPEKKAPETAQQSAAPQTAAAPANAMAPRQQPAPRGTAPAMSPPAATPAMSSAAPPAPPVVVVTAPALPAGYKPSPSVADDPVKAAEMQKMAAATGAMPTPPAMTGSMKDMAAAGIGAGNASWRAHLASHRTESAAINEWQELLKANPALYGQFDPQIEWIDTPNRGAYARLLLVGFAERKDADAACAKIRSSTRYCASVKD